MAIQTFFGEDLNGDPNTPLASTPNSDAAYAQWIAVLASGPFTQNFDSISTIAADGSYLSPPPAGAVFPFSFTFSNGVTATLKGSEPFAGRYSGVYSLLAGQSDGFGRYPITLPNMVVDVTIDMECDFSQGINAFGFYGTDIGDFGGQLILTLTDALGNTTNVTVPNQIGTGTGSPQDGNALFFGFVDRRNLYTKILFNNNSAGLDTFGFDNFSIGNALTQLEISLFGTKRYGKAKEAECSEQAPAKPARLWEVS